MEDVVKNDYDRIALAIDKALTAFTGNAHEPLRNDNPVLGRPFVLGPKDQGQDKGSDSITMTKDGFITGIIRLQRLRNWVEGLAEAHRAPLGGKTSERYPMCKDQPAQVDCHVKDCPFHLNEGQCSNVSPAITLNPNHTYVCWTGRHKCQM